MPIEFCSAKGKIATKKFFGGSYGRLGGGYANLSSAKANSKARDSSVTGTATGAGDGSRRREQATGTRKRAGLHIYRSRDLLPNQAMQHKHCARNLLPNQVREKGGYKVAFERCLLFPLHPSGFLTAASKSLSSSSLSFQLFFA